MVEKKKKKNHTPVLLFIYTHTHTQCIFRCPSVCARRQFYVVADPGLWSRCLGSDNIMTESTGVTRRDGHTRTQIDTCKDTYCMSRWMARLFVLRRHNNVIQQGIILCIQLPVNNIYLESKKKKKKLAEIRMFYHEVPTRCQLLYEYAPVKYDPGKHDWTTLVTLLLSFVGAS